MKHGLVKGGLYCLGTGVAEVLLMMVGVLTLDEHGTTGPIKGEAYVPFPNWLYLVLPLLVGLVVFLSTWNKDIEADRRNCAAGTEKS